MTLFRRNNDVRIALCVRWDRTTLPLRPRLHYIKHTVHWLHCSGCWFHLGSAYLHIELYSNDYFLSECANMTATVRPYCSIIKLERFPQYWPVGKGIHWWPVDSLRKTFNAGLWSIDVCAPEVMEQTFELWEVWDAMLPRRCFDYKVMVIVWLKVLSTKFYFSVHTI